MPRHQSQCRGKQATSRSQARVRSPLLAVFLWRQRREMDSPGNQHIFHFLSPIVFGGSWRVVCSIQSPCNGTADRGCCVVIGATFNELSHLLPKTKVCQLMKRSISSRVRSVD